MAEILGWASSLVLLVTILQQIRKQWNERSGEGVSSFLFVGQTCASLGFTIYSALVRNWVFTVTNALMLISAITGLVITLHFKRSSAPQNESGPRRTAHEGAHEARHARRAGANAGI